MELWDLLPNSPKPTKHNIRLLEQAASLVALAIELDDERQQKIAINEKYSSFTIIIQM